MEHSILNSTFIDDAMDRMLTASGTYAYNGKAYASNASYDPQTGNIASKDGNAYTYSPTKPHAVIQAGSRTFSYDANGNMTHENGIEKFVYNPDGILITRGNYTYTYDGDGKRATEQNPGEQKITFWIGNYYEKANIQSSNTFNEYIYADGIRIGMRRNNQISYWFHLDHLGGTHLITMADGQFNSRDLYKAWGEQRLSQGNTDTRYFFTGQMREDENLYYYGARWYDPSLGRFLQADTILPVQQGTQGWDMYAYVNNNPMIYVDPTGNRIEVIGSEEDIENYNKTIAYLERSPLAKELIEKLEDAVEVFTITFNNKHIMEYDDGNREIRFDPYSALLLRNGSIQSPALGLAHEFGHASQHLEMGGNYSFTDNEILEDYNLLVETGIAGELGEPIRNDYYDGIGTVRTNSPIPCKHSGMNIWPNFSTKQTY